MASALPLGLPLTDLHLQRLERVELLAGPEHFHGWGVEGTSGSFFLDAAGRRFYGDTLHQAIGQALRSLGAQP